MSPVVAYLAHESCEATGRVFSVGGGRIAEVFIGEAQGFQSGELTPELVAENWDAITDRDGYVVPANSTEETALYAARAVLICQAALVGCEEVSHARAADSATSISTPVGSSRGATTTR